MPSGSTKLRAGQVIEFECQTADEEVRRYLYDIVGKPPEVPPVG